jgi:hypothetical protein
VSLERLVEESKADYYRALLENSDGWHEGRHDLLPWLNFFLVILRRAYRELEDRAEALKKTSRSKTAMVEAAVDAFPGSFTVRELRAACPSASAELVRKVLLRLRAAGRVRALGRGPGQGLSASVGNDRFRNLKRFFFSEGDSHGGHL